jgi:Flp pilus assembly pilin Flp
MKNRLQQLGQGMTEYIIIVALIAIAAIAIYGIFGETIREQMGVMTEELSGTESTIATDAEAGAAAQGAGKTLDSFDDGSQTGN